ncbi:hypothetical protein SLA2020_050480 [Shorea laevis]
MVLKEARGGRRVTKDELFEVPIWIQIHGLSSDRLTIATGKWIGAKMGKLIDVDAGDGDVWGTNFIQIRVGVDIRKPL